MDIFVTGVGTGGTVSGAGRFLKSVKPGLKVVVAEPTLESIPSPENLYPDEIDGVHKVSEVPPEQLPKNFDKTVVDEVIALSTAQARRAALALVAEEGVFAGVSSGAVLWAATELATRPANADKLIVAVLPDTGERYLASTALGD